VALIVIGGDGVLYKGETMTTASDGLLKKYVTVQVGEEQVSVGEFVFAKTIAATTLISQVIELTGAKDFLNLGEGQPNFFEKLLSVIPKAMQEAIPPFVSLIGLFATSNQKIAQYYTQDEDIYAYVAKEGKRIVAVATTPQIIELVKVSLSQMGLEPILGNLTALLPTLLGSEPEKE
jgi:hypothetical protein